MKRETVYRWAILLLTSTLLLLSLAFYWIRSEYLFLLEAYVAKRDIAWETQVKNEDLTTELMAKSQALADTRRLLKDWQTVYPLDEGTIKSLAAEQRNHPPRLVCRIRYIAPVRLGKRPDAVRQGEMHSGKSQSSDKK